MRDIKIQLTLTYLETYTLFDDEGQVVIANKDYKKKLIKQVLESTKDDVYHVGEH